MKKFLIAVFSLTALLFFSAGVTSTHASPNLQTFTTPTPGADGRIIWIVKEGESCNLISSITSVPITQLRALNRLDENCTLRIGQELLIGITDPNAQLTAVAPQIQVTNTPVPTPTQEIGQASICVLLFEDVNGDAFRQETELPIQGGAISITGTSGQYSETANTDAVEPVCFENILSGPYTISIGLPEGYNPTTQQNYSINIIFGEQVYVDFGAQVSGITDVVAENEPAPAAKMNIIGIIGIALIMVAAGLAVFAFFFIRKRTKL